MKITRVFAFILSASLITAQPVFATNEATSAPITPTLESIEIATLPDKTAYVDGERFDATGLELTVTYTNGETKVISSGYEIESDTILTEGQNSITVSYAEDGETVATDVAVEAFPPEHIPEELQTWAINEGPGTSYIMASVKDSDLGGYVLNIDGIGPMRDFAEDEIKPWTEPEFMDKYPITEIVIHPGVTSIGDNAFTGLNQHTAIPTTVRKVTIADSVTWIGGHAFEGVIGATDEQGACIAYGTLTLGKGVTHISAAAFKNCNVTELVIPGTVNWLGAEAFAGCSYLTKVKFNQTADMDVTVNPGAFYCQNGEYGAIATTVIANNADVLGYDWATINRTVTFKTT